MRIIHRNLKDGEIKVMPENLDDLWYLKNIIEVNDLVLAKSYRRIKDETKTRADKGTRKPIFVGLRVEETSFHRYANRVRVFGIIEQGPEDLISLGSHHTIEIQPNDSLTIIKEWKKWQLKRLREAEKSAKAPLLLIVSMEDGEAEFAVVRRYGVDFTARISHSISGKRVEKGREESVLRFNNEVAAKIEEVLKKEDIKAVIICGPGFTKDNFFRYLKEKYQKIAGITYMESAGAGGRAGIQEILKRGIAERVVKENRVSYEATFVEKLFIEIAKGSGLAAYGIEEVEKAIAHGAVETLLISDHFLRTYREIDALIERTKKIRGRAVTISNEHEAGERLEGIGGIAALLRFTIS